MKTTTRYPAKEYKITLCGPCKMLTENKNNKTHEMVLLPIPLVGTN